MGVLGNKELEAAIHNGRLTIDPPPSPPAGEKGSPYDTCSVKLHLDNILMVPKKALKLSFDLSQPGKLDDTIESVCTRVEIPPNGYTLAPGQFVLGQTSEVVGFPSSQVPLAGRIEGRSSFARTGLLVHFTAPTLHAGWTGKIALELLNHGPLQLLLRPGLEICQLIVETVVGSCIPTNDQQFQNQNSPSGATAPAR